MLDVIQANIKVSITSQRAAQTLAFQFGFNEGSYEALFVPGTSFTSTNGFDIQWLRWLLESGDDIISVGYKYKAGAFGTYSRSGEGIMISARNGMWRVPSGFSGTEEQNFITRIFRTTEYEIFRYVEQVIQG